jgi:hypothetical protein
MAMKGESPFPTSAENIVIRLLYEWLGEQPYNRTMHEYVAIAQRVPKTLSIHAYVNQRLKAIVEARQNLPIALRSHWPYQICRFKAGDRRILFEDFPASLSVETVRKALKKSGLLELRSMAPGS